jgi:hypothetical protein
VAGADNRVGLAGMREDGEAVSGAPRPAKLRYFVWQKPQVALV